MTLIRWIIAAQERKASREISRLRGSASLQPGEISRLLRRA
jgi:hypothetical protein